MSNKLIPSDPASVSVIRSVTPNIVTVSAPFLRAGLFKIGGRGTIVRLGSGALAVFSPTALTDAVRAEVDKLGGRVRYLVAPDIEHHIFISDWAKAYPDAHLLGPEGLPEKRAANDATKSHAEFQHVWTAATKDGFKVDDEFDAEFDHEFVHVHANKELVFNYKRDRTLIQADLLFNLPATEQYSRSNEQADTGILTRLFASLMHTRSPALGQQRLIWYMVGAKNRPAFAASMQRINSWDFDRIIPCHGDVIETGGKGVFQKIMAWHLQGQGAAAATQSSK